MQAGRRNIADDRKTDKKKPFRHRKTMRMAMLSHALTERSLRRKGFVQTEIVSRWRAIVGDEISQHSIPVKLTFPRGRRLGASLLVRCESSYAPIVQHQQAHIISRINMFFGYAAVEKVTISQGPVRKESRPARKVVKPLSSEESSSLDQLVGPKTEASELRQALRSLGENVIGSTKDTVS